MKNERELAMVIERELEIERCYVEVPKSKYFAKLIDGYLNAKGKNEDECLNENQTLTYTAVFKNGYEMDIKVCGVEYIDGEDNSAWTEAVLFHYGSEVACTEPSDEFFGTWEMHDGNKVFQAIIEKC